MKNRIGRGALVSAGVVAALLGSAWLLDACSDPPGVGQLAIDVDRVGIRSDVTSITFTVTELEVFATRPAAPSHKDVSCRGSGATRVTVPPTQVTIDLTNQGRTFVGAFNVAPQAVREVWLVIKDATVATRGLTRPLHTSFNCGDLPSGTPPPDGGDADAPDDELGVIRLVTSDDSIAVASEKPTEIAAQLDDNTDVLHTHGNTVVTADGGGKGNGGDLHGGRWAIAGALPFVFVPPDSASSLVPGEVVVRFKDGVSQSTIDGILAAKGLTILRRWAGKNYFDVKLPNGADEKDVLVYLHDQDAVAYVAPNTYVQVNTIDPAFSSQVQWPQVGLNETATGADPTTGWGSSTGSFRPVVAIVDIGTMLNHPDLIQNLFVNVGEIPPQIIQIVGDRNGDGVADWHDFDTDGDGIITYGDLDTLNTLFGGQVCPAANMPPTTQCDPLDLVNGTGTAGAPCPTPGNPPPAITYGWENGQDDDCNGFGDDVTGWSFNSNNNLPMPTGTSAAFNHGTVTASIVGAAGFNGTAIAGVNWQVRLLPVQPMLAASFTHGTRAFRDTVYAAIQYATTTMHADVLNCSLGCYVTADGKGDFSPQCGEYNLDHNKYDAFVSQLRGELTDLQASSASTVLSFSAGNSSANHDDPGIFEWPSSMTGANVLRVASVGAATHSNADQLSSFSDFGQQGTDLAAPGEWFVELQLDGTFSTGNCGATDTGCAGTSFASPMVAGTAALLLSFDPTLAGSPCRIADRILRNADTGIGNLSGKVGSGGRRLNAQRALANPVTTTIRGCP